MLAQTLSARTGIVLLLLVASALSGCHIHSMSVEREVRQTTVPAVAGAALEVRARNGSITVRETVGTEVTVTADLRAQTLDRLAAIQVVINHRAADDTLEIFAEAPEGSWLSNEGCSFDVAIPSASRVTLTASNGRLSLTGLSGPASLRTSNGSIVVSGHSGEVTARTSNGGVRIEGATEAVTVETSNGGVNVSLDEFTQGPLQITTSNGSVQVSLGRSFGGMLAARTSNGSITVDGRPADGLTRSEIKRSSATLEFSREGADSRISTSNGSIKIRLDG